MTVLDLPLRDAEDPIPLQAGSRGVTFPVDAFPAAYADMIRAVAEATQTDEAMAGVSALSVLAAACGGRATIEARPGWTEGLNLFTATIAEPGERKSAVQAAMIAPLLDAERALVEAGAAGRAEALTRLDVAKRESEAARAKAGSGKGTLEEAIAADEAVREMHVPPLPRIVAGDATPEAVAGLLAEQAGSIAILSAEGGIFDIIGGRYSSCPNIEVILHGHAGDQIRVDRKGRDPEHIDRPALTIGVMIQRHVIREAGRNGAFRGRGLLDRFQYSRPESQLGRRKAGAASVPDRVRAEYADAVKGLATGLRVLDEAPVIRLDHDAAQCVIALETEIEPHLDPHDGSLAYMQGWASKWVGSVVRIAGLLHLAEHGSSGPSKHVTAETMGHAAAIGDYFRDQAVGVYQDMGGDETTRQAVYLLARIRAHCDKTGALVLSQRDMLRTAQVFKTKADLEPALTRLEDYGWLTMRAVEHTGTSRPPSPKFDVHPQIWDLA